MAVINNVKPAEAIRHGMVEEEESDGQTEEVQDDGQSFFIPETNPGFSDMKKPFGFGAFNPEATPFAPSTTFQPNAISAVPTPSSLSAKFGQTAAQSVPSSNGGPQQLTKRFGESFAQAQNNAPQLSTKFGENAVPTAPKRVFGQDSTSIFGGAKAKENNDSPPNFLTMFGQPRPSNTENNPFGQQPTQPAADVAASTQPGQDRSLGPTSAPGTASVDFNFKSPFGIPHKQLEQPATTTTSFQSARLTSTELQDSKPQPSGLSFASPAALPNFGQWPSSTHPPAISPAPPTSSVLQESLPSFSFDRSSNGM